MNICRHCKINEGTIIDCVHPYNKYYTCRDCNSLRARKYRKTPEGKNAYRKAMKVQYDKNYAKILARGRLNYHKRKGNIDVPNKCSECNEVKKLEAHHSDYSRPLDVTWLCRECHCKV